MYHVSKRFMASGVHRGVCLNAGAWQCHLYVAVPRGGGGLSTETCNVYNLCGGIRVLTQLHSFTLILFVFLCVFGNTHRPKNTIGAGCGLVFFDDL